MMSEIKRYKMWGDGTLRAGGDRVVITGGEYVLASDYDRLKEERDLLLAVWDAWNTSFEDTHILDEGIDGYRVACGEKHHVDCALCAAADAYDQYTWRKGQGR